MAAMVTAQEESGRLYTHQTENVCADPPSKPASQDMLACVTPGETDRDVAAWGLVPEMGRAEAELMESQLPAWPLHTLRSTGRGMLHCSG